jgi:hypothetical protein
MRGIASKQNLGAIPCVELHQNKIWAQYHAWNCVKTKSECNTMREIASKQNLGAMPRVVLYQN